VAIEFHCPHCNKLLTTSDSRGLALAKCPACDQLITVPAMSTPAQAPSPAFAATAAWSGGALSGEAMPGAPISDAPDQSSPIVGTADRSGLSIPAIQPQSVVAGPADSRLQSPFGQRPEIPVCASCGQPAMFGAAYCAACGVPLIPAAHPLQYAGLPRRMLAALVDLTIVGLAAGALDLLLGRPDWGVVPFLILYLFYNAGLESSPDQATIGKHLFGMMVCATDGRRLTFARAAIHTLAKGLSLLICGVGFIMPLLTPRKQALHDLMVDAVVVLS
jgi:uncharacterized RDD family membrane protein YckC/phage FluMu protein Com